ncbi:uncharacterized protein LOC143212521 [Lasioglossum baleicum]|uniref:uncharacterized protein LOC143212521 n=1 Tax=Lasioglossum baleicum TaxID=434251 RepID=UPI003FCE9567
MSRSICTVFVVLAISQIAVVSDAEQGRTVNLKLTNQASPAADLIDVERASTRFIGDLTVGEHVEGESVHSEQFEFENGQNKIFSLELGVTVPNGTIHYFTAVNKKNSTVVICDTPLTLGSSKAVIKLRMPPNSKPKIVFTAATH